MKIFLDRYKNYIVMFLLVLFCGSGILIGIGSDTVENTEEYSSLIGQVLDESYGLIPGPFRAKGGFGISGGGGGGGFGGGSHGNLPIFSVFDQAMLMP